MNTVGARLDITEALLAMLTAATGRPVGDHTSPDDTPRLDAPAAQLQEAFPYCIVYSVDGGSFDGPPLGAPAADTGFSYQITSVGLRRDQAEWMADLVRRCILAQNVNGNWQVNIKSPVGWSVADRLSGGAPSGIMIEGEPPYRVYSTAERYTIQVTPA